MNETSETAAAPEGAIPELMNTVEDMVLVPLRGSMTVVKVDQPNKTKGGLLLAGSLQNLYYFARIEAMGAPIYLGDGDFECVDLEVGDIVMVPRPRKPGGDVMREEPWIKAGKHDKQIVIPQTLPMAKIDGYDPEWEEPGPSPLARKLGLVE